MRKISAAHRASSPNSSALTDNRFRRHNARSREGRLAVLAAAVVEISELTDATAANTVFMHDAAAEWDGSDTIWVLGA